MLNIIYVSKNDQNDNLSIIITFDDTENPTIDLPLQEIRQVM